jgi:CBS domain-containing protein
MRTGQACSREVVATGGATPLTRVAQLMRENHVGSIVIIDEADPRKPKGILTDRDIVVEVVAAGLDPKTVTAGEIMTRAPATTSAEADLMETLGVMRRRGVRRLPVLDADGNLAGMVTLDDILEAAGRAVADVAGALASERSVERFRRP